MSKGNLAFDDSIIDIYPSKYREILKPEEISNFPSNFPYELLNKRNKFDGLDLLKLIPNNSIKTCFFDPQYRGILDKQKYGNEGIGRGKRRVDLQQMSEETIIEFIEKIEKALLPSGHLFLWIDKFHLLEGFKNWFNETAFEIVDMITWEKHRIGMGYRSRRKSEYCVIVQKKPKRAKGCWTIHNIPDVWQERVEAKLHPHAKPIELQRELIKATTVENDIVLDPCMGSGSVLSATLDINRNFIGGDIDG